MHVSVILSDVHCMTGFRRSKQVDQVLTTKNTALVSRLEDDAAMIQEKKYALHLNSAQEPSPETRDLDSTP